MPSVTITLTDLPTGGMSIDTDYKPAVGQPVSRAQLAAQEIISRTRREYGLVKASAPAALRELEQLVHKVGHARVL